jgi:signal transduction histidine kinase/integral membrane sensor domain MASE1
VFTHLAGILHFVILTISYFVIAKLGLLMATLNGSSSPIWLASGFALFALTRWGNKYFPMVFFGSLLANYSSESTVALSLLIALGNTSGAVLGSWMYNKLCANAENQLSCHSKPLIYLAVSFTGALVSASVGNLALVWMDIVSADSIRLSWITWAIGNTIGSLMIFPIMQMFFETRWRELLRAQGFHLVLGLATSILVAILVFQMNASVAMVFVIFFFSLILMATQHREVAYLSALVFYAFAIVLTFENRGPFSTSNANQSLLYLQFFFGCYSLSLITMDILREKNALQIASMALGVGWLVTALVFQTFMTVETELEEANLKQFVNDSMNRVDATEKLYVAALRATAGFVEMQKNLKPGELVSFFRRLGPRKLPGVVGIGFGEIISKNHIIPKWEGIDSTTRAPSLEDSSGDLVWQVAARSGSERRVAVTSPINLLYGERIRRGCIIFYPVFASDQQLRGWVYAPLDFQEFFRSGQMALHDQLDYSVAFAGDVIYSSSFADRPVVETSKWRFADQSLKIQWSKSIHFRSAKEDAGVWVLIVGMLVTLLMAAFVGNMQVVGDHVQAVADRVTRQLQKSQGQLVNAAKFSALGEMAAGIAHEINNPLAIIMGGTDQIARLTRKDELDVSRISEIAERISRTVRRISQIIIGLKSFARNSEGEAVSRFQISSLIDETLIFCQERFKNGNVDLRIRPFESFEVEARQAQLSQVLLNLLNNAYDAASELNEKWVELEVKKIGGTDYEIRVTDSGNGIPETTVEKMMQPFFTTKEVGSGTGLGLSISKGIMEVHRGQLIYDANSKNTRFVMRLPMIAEGSLKKAA